MKKIFTVLIVALLAITAITAASAERSDFNSDGKVNLEDFFAFAEKYGARAGDNVYETKYDLDNSGRLDMEDFTLFSEDFNDINNPVYKGVNGYAVNKVNVIPYENRVDAHVTLRNTGDKQETIAVRAYLIDSNGRVVSRSSDGNVRLALRQVHRALLSLDKPEAGKYVLVVEADNNKQNGYTRRYMDVEIK